MTDNSGRADLATRMVHTLPGWGQWANDIRDFETPFGKIGSRQASVLWVLRYNVLPPTQQTPTNLARHFGIQNSAVTRAVDKLESGGYLAREVSLSDRRTHRLMLTERGIAVSVWIEELYTVPLQRALNDLEPEQIATLHESIELLFQILRRMLTLADNQPGHSTASTNQRHVQ